MLTFNWEKAWITLALPTLRSVQFYATKVIEICYDLHSVCKWTLSVSMLSFLGTLLLYDTFLCLLETELKLIFTSVLIRETGRKRNRILPIRRKKKLNTPSFWQERGDSNLHCWTRKLMTLFLFEVHWPKYQDEQTFWQSLTAVPI